MLALPPPAPLHCNSAATMYVDGPLRVFGKGFRFHDADETEVGHKQYACLSGGRPVATGEDGLDNGTYGFGVEKYVFAGGRYLAATSYEEGEGGATQFLEVYDLRTGKHRSVNATQLDGAKVPNIRLSANGDLVIAAGGAIVAGKQVLAEKDATGLAVAGTTVYWTQPDGPHSAVLPGPPSDAPDDVLAPVSFSRTNPCDSRSGTTIARTPHVRVARRTKTAFACRVGRDVTYLLARTVRDVHVSGDRWLYAADGGTAMVIDMRTLELVTKAPVGIRHVLLDDGTLAWTDAAGQLFAQRPGAAATTLESAGASALTSSGTTVYWTAGGAAHSSTA
jgi:hypothetical protein